MPLSSARTLLTAAALLIALPDAVFAQSPANISPGMQVVDPSGANVGMVSSVKGNQLIVKTDKHEVLLPATSFTPSDGKLLFALTQAQLNAQTEQAIAEANAKLVSGASVFGEAGTLAGTIDSIDASTVTLKLTSGQLVRMPRSAVAAGPNGAILGVSAAELQKLAEQARN